MPVGVELEAVPGAVVADLVCHEPCIARLGRFGKPWTAPAGSWF